MFFKLRAMERRAFIKTAGVFGLISMTPLSELRRMLKRDNPFEIKKLRGDIYTFTERGGTIAFKLHEEGVVVVDAQFPEQAGHLIAELKNRAVNRVNLLINTHHHWDHTAGNIAFKDMADMLLAHENSRKNQMRVAGERDTETENLYPDTLYTDSWKDTVAGEAIELKYHGPAHTDGDSVIHFQDSNVVHTGDLIFNRRYPYIDQSAGASISNWITTLKEVHKEFDQETLFVFGHAGEGWPVTGKREDLEAMANYLDCLLEFVKKEVKSGKSLEAISAPDTGIPGAPEWQGRGLGRNLQAAWNEVNGN